MRLTTLMLLQVKQTMTSLYCYDNSNVNVILAIANFDLYLTPLCDRFQSAFVNGHVNANKQANI